MRLYLDTSALVKLVIDEAETDSLYAYLQAHDQDSCVSAALVRAELIRAVRQAGPEFVTTARQLLEHLDCLALTTSLLDAAGSLLPGTALRSLDAVHLAAASKVTDLRALVTYDSRMCDAATQLGMPTASPGFA